MPVRQAHEPVVVVGADVQALVEARALRRFAACCGHDDRTMGAATNAAATHDRNLGDFRWIGDAPRTVVQVVRGTDAEVHDEPTVVACDAWDFDDGRFLPIRDHEKPPWLLKKKRFWRNFFEHCVLQLGVPS